MKRQSRPKRGRRVLLDKTLLNQKLGKLSQEEFFGQFAEAKKKMGFNTFKKAFSGKPETFDHKNLVLICKMFKVKTIDELSGTVALNLPVENEYFRGRKKSLDLLESRFGIEQSINEPSLTKRIIIHGMRGVGKSQLAAQFAQRNLSSKKFQLVFWADGSDMVTSYNEFATYLGLKSGRGKSIVEEVKSWLSRLEGLPWLLVVDDMESASSVARFLPETQSGGHILFTTSKKDAHDFELLNVRKDDRIEVPIMSRQAAVEFLLDRTGTGSQTSEQQAVEDLAEELGYLPLALEQAGAYILQKTAPFEEYLTTYRKCEDPIALLDSSDPIYYSVPVAKTWQVSFQAVKEESLVAAELLYLSAFLHPNGIPIEIIRDGSSELGSVISKAIEGVERQPLLLREALEPLARYSLIRYQDQQTYSIHKLVQEVLRNTLNKDDTLVWIERTVRVMEMMFPFPKFENWSLCHRMFSNAELATKYVEHYCPRSPLLPARVGLYLCQSGDYPAGESLLKLHLESIEDLFPAESHIISSCLRLLGHYYHVQGKFQESENAFLRCLEIFLKSQKFPDEDLYELASCYTALATLYYDMGKSSENPGLFAKAEKCLLSLINETEQDDERLISCLYELGAIYSRYQKHTKATEFFEQAFQIWDQSGSEDLMQIEDVLYMLGRTYIFTKKYSKAKSALTRALKIRKELYQPNHPTIADTLALLGELYMFQEKFAEAEAEFKQAQQIVEKCIKVGLLKESAPIWDRILEKISLCYMMQGKKSEQEYIDKILVDKLDRGIGEGILPKVSSTLELRLNNLGQTYLLSQRKYSEAEAVYRRLLGLIVGRPPEESLRPLDDPESDFVYLRMLGFACMGQKKYDEAEEVFDWGINILEEMGVGDEKLAIPPSFLFYSDYVSFRAHKAVLYKIQGRDAEAAEYEKLTLKGIDFFFFIKSINPPAEYGIENQLVAILQIYNLVAPFPEAEGLWKQIKLRLDKNTQKQNDKIQLDDDSSVREEIESKPDKKLGRNEFCWCGSGKKYKNCHWASDRSQTK